MWIKMLKDQVRPWGIYLKGQTHSLPAKLVREKLDIDSYEEIEMDENTILLQNAEAKLGFSQKEQAVLDAAIKSAKERVADLNKRRRVISVKAKQATQEIDQIEQARQAAENTEESKEQSTDEGPQEQTDGSPPAGTADQGDNTVAEG